MIRTALALVFLSSCASSLRQDGRSSQGLESNNFSELSRTQVHFEDGIESVTPVEVEVAQAFFNRDKLNVKVVLKTLKEFNSDEVVLGVLGLKQGEIVEQSFKRVKDVIAAKTIDSETKVVARFELQSNDLTEYQVSCTWGEKAKQKWASVNNKFDPFNRQVDNQNRNLASSWFNNGFNNAANNNVNNRLANTVDSRTLASNTLASNAVTSNLANNSFQNNNFINNPITNNTITTKTFTKNGIETVVNNIPNSLDQSKIAKSAIGQTAVGLEGLTQRGLAQKSLAQGVVSQLNTINTIPQNSLQQNTVQAKAIQRGAVDREAVERGIERRIAQNNFQNRNLEVQPSLREPNLNRAMLSNDPRSFHRNPSIQNGNQQNNAPSSLLKLNNLDVIAKEIECGRPPCKLVYTVVGEFYNGTASFVKTANLAVGLYWVNNGQLPNLPKKNSQLNPNEEILSVGLDLESGNSKEFSIKLDKEVPQIAGGSFIPHVRLVRQSLR